jgi:hypothetical protein
MSKDFRPSRLITAADLFGGRLKKHGVREIVVEGQDMQGRAAEMGLNLPEGALGGKMPGTTEYRRCLTDGTNYMWVEISSRGFVASIYCTISNDPDEILNAVAKEFDTDIISEHDVEFWEDYEGEVMEIRLSDFEKL